MIKDICLICGRPLKNGIIINGKIICSHCEKKIVQTDMDTDFYDYYKEKIRKYVVKCMIKRERDRCNNYHL